MSPAAAHAMRDQWVQEFRQILDTVPDDHLDGLELFVEHELQLLELYLDQNS